MSDRKKQLKILQNVLELEAQSLLSAAKKITEQDALKATILFDSMILNDSQLIFCGVGKSGLIAKKLASTFCSLGVASFSLHPTEALHGDLGRVRPNDVIVFISKSGTTEEIIKLKTYLSQPKGQLVGLLGNIHSPIAEFCDLVLDCSVEKEACLNNQAPTTSTTVALAMGDALAVLYEAQVGLSKEKFAFNHPGGLLGKSLRVKVKDIMVPIKDCPVMTTTQKLKEALIEMTAKPVGACAVLSQSGKFHGILVEGDIRRTLTSFSTGLETELSAIANQKPISVLPEQLAFEALELMERREKPLNIIPVIEDERILGFLRLHDLMKEGFSVSKRED